jgi:hypothetical protein
VPDIDLDAIEATTMNSICCSWATEHRGALEAALVATHRFRGLHIPAAGRSGCMRR